MTPPWERPLRVKLATLCMAANVGKPGDLTEATQDIVDFVKRIAAVDQVQQQERSR